MAVQRNSPLLKAAVKIRELIDEDRRAPTRTPSPKITPVAEKADKYRELFFKYKESERAQQYCWEQHRHYAKLAVYRSNEYIEEGEPQPKHVESARDIYKSLLHLQEKYGLRCSLKRKELAITTERIVFDDLDLGPFEIILCWGGLPSKTLRVMALEPNPAEDDEDVTHPHIKGGILCEGEWGPVHRQMLRQGLIGEFFESVYEIVNTYNPDSPYVAVEAWGDSSCSECGYGEQGELECGHWRCSECSMFCDSCDREYCSGCIVRCSDECENYICDSCKMECPNCNRYGICESCLCPCPECSQQTCSSCAREDDTCSEQCETQHRERRENNE